MRAALPGLALAACARTEPPRATPLPELRWVQAGCGGGVTGGGSGVIVTNEGGVYKWARSRPAPAPMDSALVRTDTAFARDVFRQLQAMDFMRLALDEPGNMTCFLAVGADSTLHEVAWPMGDPRAPRQVTALLEQLQRAESDSAR